MRIIYYGNFLKTGKSYIYIYLCIFKFFNVVSRSNGLHHSVQIKVKRVWRNQSLVALIISVSGFIQNLIKHTQTVRPTYDFFNSLQFFFISSISIENAGVRINESFLSYSSVWFFLSIRSLNCWFVSNSSFLIVKPHM